MVLAVYFARLEFDLVIILVATCPVAAVLVDLVDPALELGTVIRNQTEVTHLTVKGVASQPEVGPGPHDVGHLVDLLEPVRVALFLRSLLDV